MTTDSTDKCAHNNQQDECKACFQEKLVRMEIAKTAYEAGMVHGVKLTGMIRISIPARQRQEGFKSWWERFGSQLV